MKNILNPDQSITLVKLKCTSRNQVYDMVEIEAGIVEQIVDVYLASHVPKGEDGGKPIMVGIVTPLNKQRIAIKKKVPSAIPVGTVETMQEQECNLVIVCFSCTIQRTAEYEVLRDFRRWNIALSRAK